MTEFWDKVYSLILVRSRFLETSQVISLYLVIMILRIKELKNS